MGEAFKGNLGDTRVQPAKKNLGLKSGLKIHVLRIRWDGETDCGSQIVCC